MATDMILVWTTVPAESVAHMLAETVVNEQLAACVHVLPAGRSFYRWQDQLQQEVEWTLLMKTRQAVYPRLEARLRSLHPYELPEILATSVTHVLPAYGAWVVAATGGVGD
ncbi:MAG: divalent-cation tolerance protein CutA [Magnetococcales bacterium]|nr:divalent-cation tolerance protein CutA [Magnetococcales bacterium]